MARNAVYERMVNASSRKAAECSLLILDKCQDYIESDNSVQVLASAAVFLLLCERFGVSAQDAFTAAKNMLADHDGRASDFRAVRDYVRNEVH